MSLFILILFITLVWYICGVQILQSYYPFLGQNKVIDALFAFSNPWKLIFAIGPIFLVFLIFGIIVTLVGKIKK